MKDSVLLIEDDRLMRITLEDALTAAGYHVASFRTGEEALSAFRTGTTTDRTVNPVVGHHDQHRLDLSLGDEVVEDHVGSTIRKPCVLQSAASMP